MGYTKTTFDHTADGTEVYRYTLTNEQGVSASFTNFGAIWLTMSVPDKNGQFDDVILGYDSVDSIQTQPGHPGEPVGRNANRIGGAKFTLNGVTYELAKNSAEVNNLHSGPDYYRDRIWDAEVEETALGTTITFGLHSPDGDQGYPGNADITVSYTLTPDNCLKLDYHMVSDADTIANFTNHVYFNLGGYKSGSALDQKVWIDADYFTATDANSIPTGELVAVKGTPMDFTSEKAIGAEIEADFEQLKLTGGYDHNFILDKAVEGSIELMAVASCKESGITMEAFTDLPCVQFYAGNFIAPVTGKNGVFYDKRNGFCLESQYVPNAINQEGEEKPILEAGDTYDTTTVYKFIF